MFQSDLFDNTKLTKQEAIEYLDIDPKMFDNFFRYADEIKPIPRETKSGRFYFKKSVLIDWKKSYDWRTVILNKDDYALCMDFALAMHFRSYVVSDWGTGRQREFGQKLTNWVKGQLGEIAVQKFLQDNFDVKVKLDFDLHEEIVVQDIIGIIENGTSRAPKIGIGIKSSKPKNSYLILGENEVLRHQRQSDIYIFCRPDVPDDHLLRIAKDEVEKLVKDQPHYNSYKNNLPDFSAIRCEVAGWCPINKLEKVTEIPGQKFDKGFRYVKQTGRLYRTKEDWFRLTTMI